MVMVSNRLIRSVTAEKTAVSKKMEKPIGTPILSSSLKLRRDMKWKLRNNRRLRKGSER
ncbi:hypothetical protein D3C75_971040 [compost metagenome]